MKKRKGARPGTAIPGRAVENGTASQTAHDSTQNDTTPPAGGQRFRVADLLSHGAENGVTLRHLEKLTGLSGREVRRQGVPILSDNQHGYFLAVDSAEKRRFARSMQHRAREILRTARAIEEAAGID